MWEATGFATEPGAKRVADFTLAHWTRLLASLGRREALAVLFAQSQDRVLDGGPLEELFLATQEGFMRMVTDPGAAYRCGTLALGRIALKLGSATAGLRGVFDERSPEGGFSLAQLEALASRAGLPLVAVHRPAGDERLVIPSVIHWQQDHYAALTEMQGEYVYVVDPTFGHPRWLHMAVVNAEASGHFLVPSRHVPVGWRRLTAPEAARVQGRGFPEEFDDDDDENCPKGEAGDQEESDPAAPLNAHDPNNEPDCDDCPPGASGEGESCEGSSDCEPCEGKGLAIWRVSEPHISLWILDTPLYYTTSRGKRVPFTLSYKQRNTRPLDGTWGLGARWEASRLAYVRVNSGIPNEAALYASQGGRRVYVPDGVTRHYLSNTRMSSSGGTYTITRSTGGRTTYGFAQAYYSGITRYYPSTETDRRGRITQFFHQLTNGVVRLNVIRDPDGRDTTLSYSPSVPGRLTEVRDPYQRAALFTYDGSGRLWTIQDAHGLTSTFTYDTSGRITALTTPYGTTTFAWGTEVPLGTDNLVNRSLLVTEPGGRRHVYLYRNNSEKLTELAGAPDLLPYSYPPEEVPDTTPYANMFNNSGMYIRNSFYWGPGQYVGLSTPFKTSGNPADLTLADYRLARVRNWQHRGQSNLKVGSILNMERAPSPDGVVEGQRVWYDYAGKMPQYGHAWEGTNAGPSLVAMVLPDGSSQFTRYERNQWGLPTTATSTYANGGGISLRTTTRQYDNSGQKLTAVSGPDGYTRVAYTYDTQHPGLLRTITRYHAANQGYTTTYSYDTNGRLISRASPNGLTTSYTYTSGWSTQVTDSPVTRSESFTYLNGNVQTRTDHLGLTRTFTWDNLQRLTRLDYSSDGTFESHGYTTLDRTSTTDRRGKTSTFAYNSVRQLVSKTDALLRTTTYTYCACGSVESIRDPLNNMTSFGYDYAGRMTYVRLPGLQTVTYAYDRAGRLTGATDALGTWTATYHHQGRLATVRNPASQLYLSVTYNADDLPVSVTGPNGVVVARTFDYFARVLTHRQGTLPLETFVWSARGLVSRTDQLGKTTQYAYDAAGRRTSQTTPNAETVSYAYNAGGNLLSLTDHRNNTTTWTYDSEGRLRKKRYAGQTFDNLEYTYNPNGQVLTRKFWSSATVSRLTTYTYDNVGNLTGVTYPTGTANLSFGYDARNLLTSMTDALGTSSFGYTTTGQLDYEQAPWSTSRVSSTYNNALLRSQLTLQQPTGSWLQNYGYNSSRRLTSLTAPSVSATPFAYNYSGASRLITQLTFPNNGKVVNSYDALSRISSTSLRRQDNVELNKHAYLYNSRHERTKHTRFDNSYVNFGYDHLGQTTSALGYSNGGNPLPAEQLGFTYDGSWNLTQRSVNGTPTSYTVNVRNQVTTISGLGSASHDAHGNLTSRVYDANGPKNYADTYDDEQRLVSVATDTYYTPAASRWKSEFTYDGLSRVRVRKEYTWYSTDWMLQSETRYLYDGRRVLQERNGSNTPLVTYTRGPDLSGSLEGAGGTGGLLARSHGYSGGNWSNHNFYHADGTGNITALLDNHPSAAALSATYRYDPFGRLLSQSGSMASANLYRFASKQSLPNAGLYAYGYRFYDPMLQRWLNRDPLGELGGLNLYRFCGNSPSVYADIDGLALFGLYDSWGDYFGEVGDVLWGQTQGALESLTFGLFNPCYTSDLQKQGGRIGEGLAFTGEVAAGGYGLWKGLGKKALKEASEQLGKGARDAFLEELGQKTLKNADFDKLKDLSRVDRGKELLKEGKLGLDPRGNWKETMGKGPTPLGALGLGAYGGSTAAATALNGPTEGDCL